MVSEWWRDPELLRLQKEHLEALSAWHRVMPPRETKESELTEKQAERLRAAIWAEAAYRTRREQVA